MQRFAPEIEPSSIRRLFSRFWDYSAGNRRWLLIVTALFGAPALAEGGQLLIFKSIIDTAMSKGSVRAYVPLAAAFVAITIVEGVLVYAAVMLSARVSLTFVVRLRADVFQHLHKLSLGFFQSRQLGDILTRLTDDIPDVETFVFSGLVSAASAVFSLTVFTVLLIILDAKLAVLALALAPVMWGITRLFRTRMQSAARVVQQRRGALTGVAEESLSNVMLVQAYNRTASETERFAGAAAREFDAELRSTRLSATFQPIVDTLETAVAMGVLGFGVYQLGAGDLTLGGLIVFVAMLSRMYGPINALTQLTSEFFLASASGERIAEVLDEPPAALESTATRDLVVGAGRIEFEHVAYAYPGTPRETLSDVSFAVAGGSTVAVIGGSGSGKSTLLKLLLRFDEPSRGAMRIDGQDLREVSVDSVRANIAVLLQEHFIFDMSVADNIGFGNAAAGPAAIRQAAETADAHGFVAGLPGGYGTVVGQRGRLLSGGQRQRVALARAVVRNAPIVVLDEPTAGLDDESAARVLEPLWDATAGRTTIIISHDLRIAARADLVVLLDEGRIREVGTHAALIEQDGRYARLCADSLLTVGRPLDTHDSGSRA